MKCPRCHEHILLDEVSDTYYCETCNRLYSAEELETNTSVKLFVISFFMWIPLINVLFINLLKKRPYEEQQVYLNVFLTAMFSHIVVLALGALLFVKYRVVVTDQFLVESRRNIESTYPVIKDISKWEYIPRVEKPKEPTERPQEIRIMSFTDDAIELLDGATLNGSKVISIIEDYPEYTYLLQTTSVRTKYQSLDYYLNLGYLLREAEYDDITQYGFVDMDISGPLTPNKSVIIPSDMIHDKRLIYYIYGTEKFAVNILRGNAGGVIGLAFTEQEE